MTPVADSCVTAGRATQSQPLPVLICVVLQLQSSCSAIILSKTRAPEGEPMIDFSISPELEIARQRAAAFMEEFVYPNESKGGHGPAL